MAEKIKPAKKARKWALVVFGLITISNLSVFSQKGLEEFLARTLIVGGILSIAVFLIVWLVISFKNKKNE